jgi:hypothetical protein
LPLVTFLAIMLSQAYLLGLWTAFSDAALWSRVLVLGIGTVYLEGLIGLVAGYEGVQLLAATTSLSAVGVLFTARRWGREHRKVTEPTGLQAPERWVPDPPGSLTHLSTRALLGLVPLSGTRPRLPESVADHSIAS